MVVPGKFKTPLMAREVESYSAVGEGSIELDGMAIKIVSRELAMPWIGWILGAAGLLIGLVFGTGIVGLSGKALLFAIVGPAVAGFAAGHLIGRAIGVRRPPKTGVLGLESVRGVRARGAVCEIVVQPFTAPLMITFAPSRPEDVQLLVQGLSRYVTRR